MNGENNLNNQGTGHQNTNQNPVSNQNMQNNSGVNSQYNTNQTQPVQAQVQPQVVQTQPVQAQIQSQVVQTQPVQAQIQPQVVQTQPVQAQVQPQVQQPTQPTNIQVEFVNPLNPNQILKAENLVANQAKIENSVQPNESAGDVPPKRKKKINLVAIVIAVMILALGGVIYFTFFGNSKEETPAIVTNEKLTNIVNNLKNNKEFKKLSFDSIITEVNVNTLNLTVTDNNVKTVYTFKLENSMLKTEVSNDDLNGNILVLFVLDAAGQTTGLNANELMSLLNSIDLTTTKINGLEISETNTKTILSMDLSKKIDTSILNSIYFEENDLNKDKLNSEEAFYLNKGKLVFYKYTDNNQIIITIGEKKLLSDISYQSLLSLVNVLYPEELEAFKTNYVELVDKAFGRYNITIDPVLDDASNLVLADYTKEYKFMQIKIDKSL